MASIGCPILDKFGGQYTFGSSIPKQAYSFLEIGSCPFGTEGRNDRAIIFAFCIGDGVVRGFSRYREVVGRALRRIPYGSY